MKKSQVVLAFEKVRVLNPAITKVVKMNDMTKIITQPLQPPIRVPSYNFSGLKYY